MIPSPESILFKGVDIILPSGLVTGDVFVKHGKIEAVEWSLNRPAELEIRESGLTLLPGIIDTHVHFREPGLEWKEDLASGSRAAAAGGVTSFFDMPNTKPETVSAETVADKKALAAKTSLVNYNFYVGATAQNLDDLENIENIPAIKVFMGSSTGDLLMDDPDVLDALFAKGKRLIAVHAEDEAIIKENYERYGGSDDVSNHMRIRTPEAALKATKAAVTLSEKYQRRLHILHLSTQEEAKFLAKRTPSHVTTEVCVQHLLLSAPQCYAELGTFAQINPPIRDKQHADALWKALKAGTIGMVVTDHAPHSIEEKEKGFGQAPSGMPGIETSLSLMLTLVNQGKCTLSEVVKWMCEMPAKTYDIQSKGEISVGFDADMVLVDMKAKRRIENGKLLCKCNWSAFDGWAVQGCPVITIVNGNVVYREGDFFSGVMGKEIFISQTAPKYTHQKSP